MDQASAAVAAAKAAIENNRRQKQLQQAKIDRALAGVSQAQAEISAAQAGIAAAQADLDRTLPERRRQEALMETNSTTRQKVEQVVADEERSRAQLVEPSGFAGAGQGGVIQQSIGCRSRTPRARGSEFPGTPAHRRPARQRGCAYRAHR